MSNSPDSPETWLRNFRPHINEVRVDWLTFELDLVPGATVQLSLEYEFSALIGTPQGVITIQCEPDVDLADLKISPPPGQLLDMVVGSKSLTWIVTAGEAKIDPFRLYFILPNYPAVSDSPSIPARVLDPEGGLEIKFDTFPTKTKDYAFPCLGAIHAIRLHAADTSKYLNKHIAVAWNGDPAESLGVVLEPRGNQQLTEQGISYSLDCSRGSKAGKFSLCFSIVEWGLDIAELTMDLAHNKVKAYRWRDQGGPGMDLRSHIQVQSYFTDQPISDFSVWVNHGSNHGYKLTRSDGVLTVNNGMSTPAFSILNKYDGTYP